MGMWEESSGNNVSSLTKFNYKIFGYTWEIIAFGEVKTLDKLSFLGSWVSDRKYLQKIKFLGFQLLRCNSTKIITL